MRTPSSGPGCLPVRRRPSTARIGLTATAALTLVLGASAAPATAESSYTVPIPLHQVPADLHLIGASEVGVAVQRSSVVPGGSTLVDPVFTGALGTELTPRPQLDATVGYYYPRTMSGVTGSMLTWYEHVQRAGSAPKSVHRTNLLTGKTYDDGEIGEPDAFNGESWFTDTRVSYANPEPYQPLRQHHTGPKGITSTDELYPNTPGVNGVAMAADQNSVLWATARTTAGVTSYALDLITLKTRTFTRLLNSSQRILDVELTPQSVVWSQEAPAGNHTISRQPRTGGAVTTYTESRAHADVAHLAAGAAGVGYLITTPGDPYDTVQLVVVDGASARTVDLPYGGSGLAAVGDHFLTAVGRYSSQSGVYRIHGDEVTQVATVPPAFLPPTYLTLSAGNLRFSDSSVSEYRQSRSVFERTVSSGRRATFSRERELIGTAGPMAFSAARGVVSVPNKNWIWKILDRGYETGEIEAVGEPNISGPYTMIGGKVFRPDGELIYTQGVPAGTEKGRDDLFGSLVAYARTKADGSSQIWLDEAERNVGNVLAEVPAGCDGGRPWVSVWGELVAWTSSCGDQISVRHLRTGETRLVPVVGGNLKDMFLSEGVLTWAQGYDRLQDHVLDLTSLTSVPVTLPDMSLLLSVDDHQVARQVNTGPGGDLSPQPELMPLPFSPKYPPRLIARNSPLGFTPDNDGQRDVWAPQFDFTKPLRSVTLTITNQAGTKTLASLDGTGSDGSVRDLSWNGLTGKGQQLPPGVYRWVLTGRAADGDGVLIAADGSNQISGTVEINPTVP